MKLELQAAMRMYRRAKKVRKDGFHKYPDKTPEEICKHILYDCWNADHQYFQVSAGHFCEFYVRDFAHCAVALASLGYAEQVTKTLQYALEAFEKHGHVEQAISPKGKPYSFPSYSPDALALLLHTLFTTGNGELARQHRAFLQKETERFAHLVVDPKTSLPHRHKHFSGMRDHVKREASCYDAVMIALVARIAPKLDLKFSYQQEVVAKALVAEYWNGEYFFADGQHQQIVTGDANVFPFWTGALAGAVPLKELRDMREKALISMHNAGLDSPWPLRYVSEKDAANEKVGFVMGSRFAPEYQTHSIWMNIGLCMLDVLTATDPETAAAPVKRIGELIAQHGTFLEVFDKSGEPYKSDWYVTDEAMLWCAQWLALAKQQAAQRQ